MVACFLQNRSVSQEALNATWLFLELLDRHCHKTGHLFLLPGVADARLKIDNNTILLDDFSACLRAVGLEVMTSEVTRTDLSF